jgi:hypothetical protein
VSYFEATSGFDGALVEVDIFVAHALGALRTSRAPEYSTFVKAGLVLLSAKFEAFAEGIIEDFIEQVCALKPHATSLSVGLRVHATSLLLSNCTSNGSFQHKPERIRDLKMAARLWESNVQVETIRANNKFSYGRHGSKELAALFERVGVSDIYDTCQIHEEEVESLIVESSSKRSVAPDIDSLTHLRNNIIHSDASPGNITHQQLLGYRDRLWEFAYLLDLRLSKELCSIENKFTS